VTNHRDGEIRRLKPMQQADPVVLIPCGQSRVLAQDKHDSSFVEMGQRALAQSARATADALDVSNLTCVQCTFDIAMREPDQCIQQVVPAAVAGGDGRPL